MQTCCGANSDQFLLLGHAELGLQRLGHLGGRRTGQSELDLLGPFLCRGEKNPRTTIKVWGLVIVDQNSGATHADVVVDYSTSAVLAALRRFGSLRGWAPRLSSDPGSQLLSAEGNLDNHANEISLELP